MERIAKPRNKRKGRYRDLKVGENIGLTPRTIGRRDHSDD